MDVFHSAPFQLLTRDHETDSYPQRISRWIGTIGYYLYRLNMEECKECWVQALNQEVDRCLLILSESEVLGTALVCVWCG